MWPCDKQNLTLSSYKITLTDNYVKAWIRLRIRTTLFTDPDLTKLKRSSKLHLVGSKTISVCFGKRSNFQKNNYFRFYFPRPCPAPSGAACIQAQGWKRGKGRPLSRTPETPYLEEKFWILSNESVHCRFFPRLADLLLEQETVPSGNWFPQVEQIGCKYEWTCLVWVEGWVA